jgi:serralysin
MTNPILLFGSDNPEIILGTDKTDNINALAGDDTIFGTRGDDTIVGGLGIDIDTYDYSYLGDTPITASLDIVFEEISFPDGPSLSAISGVKIDVDKGELGNDSIVDSVGEIDPNVDPDTVVGTIVAPVSLDNTFQTPSGGGTTDLSRNLYDSEGGPRIVGGVEFTIENFVNVIGNGNPDNIIGNEADNRLEGRESVDFLDGGAGNDYLIGGTLDDTLVGGEGDDTLIGGDPVVRDPEVSGFFDQDLLTGGVGADVFILGDSEGDFYAFGGDLDFATIEDFSAGDRIQLSSQETYSIQQSDGQFEIFAVKESGEDLVARVTLGDFG